MHQQQHTSIESFNRLVKLAARAFYDDITTKGENQLKSGRSDNRGIAVVVLDALTRRQWVREEDLARDLKLHSKQLRRILRLFEEEKLVTRDHRKETAKNAKMFSAAVAAVDTHHFGREGEEKAKLHTHSYCCLDYAQIHDVVRYRLQRMKKKIKDELDDKNKIQEYVCPTCQRRYTALDALRLISMVDENFHCEKCNGELVAVSDDKLATQEVGDGDDNARRRRRDKLNDMLRKLEDQLKPLTDQLGRVKDLTPPEFGSLQAWEVRANAAARADPNANDPSKNGQDIGFSSTPMPFVGETKVEVAFSGIEDKGENIKSESGSTPMKVLPPWMIKQGMNLTKEQRGEVKQEQNMDNSSVHASSSDDKKGASFEKDEKNSIQDEYIKAYYAAILKQQESVKGDPQTSVTNNTNVERQVGVKAKREDEDEGEDVEWEEDTPAGDTTESFKVDLNVEADASGDDEDEIDWEEG